MAKSDYTRISAEEFREIATYDPESGVFRWLKNCGRSRVGNEFGSWDLYGYKTVRISKRSYKLHRLAWLYVHGEWPSGDIDHINGIRHDNRISNLRTVSRGVNLQNQRNPTILNKSTGILGAYLCKKSGKFVAAISVGNKKRHIGTYDTKELASSAYIQAKRKLHPGCVI